MLARFMAAAMVVLAIVGCAGGEKKAADTTAAIPAQGSMEGMSGMQAMPMAGNTAMDRMRAHMAATGGASGDSLMRMMPEHRQMAANMMAQFNREMSQMNMPDDPRWRATLDSLRQDLARMPELSAAEMQRMMPAHNARMTRLMDMHRSMMGDMSG